MVCSMTGFGRSKQETDVYAVTVEIRTVNHRYFDCHFHMPQPFMKMEDKLKKIMLKYMKRGRVDCFITIDGEEPAAKKLHIDWALLDEYYHFINTLKSRYQLRDDPQISDFLSREEFISVVESNCDELELDMLVEKTVEEACQSLKAMREEEGNQLEQELAVYLNMLEESIGQMEALGPQAELLYKEKIYKKIKELTGEMIDEDRILTEVAIISDKSDISEELARLKSHINQFRATLSLEEPIGRKLDFLVQEMNRETNTIGAKAGFADISKLVIEMKSTMEKMREQIQNIE